MTGHISARGKNRWRLIVSVGRDPGTGKWRQVSRTVHGSKRDAEMVLTELVAQVNRGAYKGSADALGPYLEHWLDFRSDDLAPRTLEVWRGYVRTRITPALGGKPLHRLSPADLDQFYLALRRQENRSARTVRQIHAIIYGALKQAVKWGYITSNPAERATLPRVHRPTVASPDPTDVRRLIVEAERSSPALGTFLFLAVATGARRGELCALRWSDFADGFLTIARSIDTAGGELREKETKTHAIRQLALDPFTTVVLERHRARVAVHLDETRSAWLPRGYLFSDDFGESPWHPDKATAAFRRLRKTLGLEGVRLHDLRHFSVSQQLAAGIPVRTVAGRHGHANANTTLAVYGHFIQAADQQAALVMGTILDGIMIEPGERKKEQQ